jgi:hypothetical protein
MGATVDPVIGPWVRAHLAARFHVKRRTPLSRACDAIHALLAEIPGDVLGKLRTELDIAAINAGAPRDRWGTLPHQQAAMAKLM